MDRRSRSRERVHSHGSARLGVLRVFQRETPITLVPARDRSGASPYRGYSPPLCSNGVVEEESVKFPNRSFAAGQAKYIAVRFYGSYGRIYLDPPTFGGLRRVQNR